MQSDSEMDSFYGSPVLFNVFEVKKEKGDLDRMRNLRRPSTYSHSRVACPV